MTSVQSNGTVEFRFFRPNVESVNIAGDFNDWSGTSMEMNAEGNGWWSATAKLPSGEYRFRYVADGRWFTDFASHGVEMSKDGWNSVLLINEGSTQLEDQLAQVAA